MSLEPNHNLLGDTLAVTYIGEDGQIREVEEVDRSNHKVFKGRAFIQRSGLNGWSHAGWARVMVHKDGKKPLIEGAFSIDGDTHHIQTAAHYQKLKHDEDPAIEFATEGDEMVVYRDSDIQQFAWDMNELRRRDLGLASSCESDSLDFNNRFDLERRVAKPATFLSMSVRDLFGRQIDNDGDDGGSNYADTIGDTDGCPNTRKVALVGIATDCNYWEEFNENREELRTNVIDMVNRASELYESTFSISLGIRNLTVIDKLCSSSGSDSAPWNLECSDSTTLNDRLNLFSSWRGRFEDSNAYWSLLTTCNTGSAVGLAWRGQLCREGASESTDRSGQNETIAATNVVVRTSSEWQIFAHETGHTFGAVHDCTSQACPVDANTQSCCPLSTSECDADGKFIMNPSTGDGLTKFSPCSIGNICSGLRQNINGQCLTDNRNIGTITGSQCGNGIVESGEDCDCGGSEDCENNSCCDAETCKFKDGAVCDPTNEDCCTDSCNFSSKGTVCRESTGDCDPEETCSGDSGSCERDNHLSDGDGCGDGLHCASGQCTSRDMQCRAVVSGNNDTSTDACNGNSCLLSCEVRGQCTVYNQNFLDGTDCGGGGRCDSGECRGRSTWKEIVEWFENHKNIAIPVGVVLAVLLLLAIGSCFWSCVKRCKRKQRVHKPLPDMSSSPTYNAGGFTNEHWSSGANSVPPPPPGPPPPGTPMYGGGEHVHQDAGQWDQGWQTRQGGGGHGRYA